MNDLSRLLNDPELNLLADIYLDFLDLDKRRLSYRRLKNAVLIFARVGGEFIDVCNALAVIDDIPAEQIATELIRLATDISPTVDDRFNAAYCDDCEIGFMPRYKNAEDVIAFLGVTFLYVLESNYSDLIRDPYGV